MSTLARLEQEIEQLPADDFARLRDWLAALDARRFDEKIEMDATSGRLDALGNTALAELRSGRAKPL